MPFNFFLYLLVQQVVCEGEEQLVVKVHFNITATQQRNLDTIWQNKQLTKQK